MQGGINRYKKCFADTGFNSKRSGDKGTNWVKMNRV